MTNQEKIDYIFAAIDRAEISISDIQRVTRISRTALHHWKNGGNVTDLIRLGIMLKVAQNLNIACNDKRLPLQNTLKVAERIPVLRKIIANAASKRVE